MPGNQGHRREEVNKPARRYVSGDEGRHGIHACMISCALDLFSMGRGGMRGGMGGGGRRGFFFLVALFGDLCYRWCVVRFFCAFLDGFSLLIMFSRVFKTRYSSHPKF